MNDAIISDPEYRIHHAELVESALHDEPVLRAHVSVNDGEKWIGDFGIEYVFSPALGGFVNSDYDGFRYSGGAYFENKPGTKVLREVADAVAEETNHTVKQIER